MRNAIIGIVIGIVVGVVVGATVVAPRLNPAADKKAAGLQPKAQTMLPLVKEIPPPTGKALERDKRHPANTEQVDVPEASSPPKTVAETGGKPEAEAKDEVKDGAKDDAKASPNEKQDSPERPTSPPSLTAMAEVPAEKAPLIIPPHDHPPTPPPPEPMARHWKMGSAYASTLPQLGTLAKKLDRDIWRVSNGMLEIKFFEPGALVPPLEMFDAVRADVIDAAFSSPGFWSNKIPALQLFAAIPFGPSAKELLAWIYFGGGQELFDAIYRANGIHSIFCGLISPEAAGWFRNRIRTVEDLKGLKMRFFGLGAKVVRKLGVVTSRLTSGDIFVAFESGEIDAAEFSMPSIDMKLGLYRMVKNYYFPGWHQPSTLFELMINLKKWEALPVAQKAQVEAVCGDNIRYGLAEGEAAQFKALKKLQSEGVAIRRWPGEVLDALKAAWTEVVAEEARADRDFNRVWKSLSAFRENYTIWRDLNQP